MRRGGALLSPLLPSRAARGQGAGSPGAAVPSGARARSPAAVRRRAWVGGTSPGRLGPAGPALQLAPGLWVGMGSPAHIPALPKGTLAQAPGPLPRLGSPVFCAPWARPAAPGERLRFPRCWVGMRGSARALMRTWRTRADAAPANELPPDGLCRSRHVLRVARGSEASALLGPHHPLQGTRKTRQQACLGSHRRNALGGEPKVGPKAADAAGMASHRAGNSGQAAMPTGHPRRGVPGDHQCPPSSHTLWPTPQGAVGHQTVR